MNQALSHHARPDAAPSVAPPTRQATSVGLVKPGSRKGRRLFAAWERLQIQAGSRCPSPGWYRAWYRAAERSGEPLVFVAGDPSAPEAVLPLFATDKAIRLAGHDTGMLRDIDTIDPAAGARLVEFALDWLRENRVGLEIELGPLSGGAQLSRLLSPDRTETGEWKITRAEKLPSLLVTGGLAAFLARHEPRSHEKLRMVLHHADRVIPFARVTIRRDLDIRVDALSAALELVGEKEADIVVDRLAFLGEIAKDPANGLQLGQLIDGGEVLAVEIGQARHGVYQPLFSAVSEEGESIGAGECLFLSRIEDWIAKDGVSKVRFPVGYEGLLADPGHYDPVVSFSTRKTKPGRIGGLVRRRVSSVALPR